MYKDEKESVYKVVNEDDIDRAVEAAGTFHHSFNVTFLVVHDTCMPIVQLCVGITNNKGDFCWEKKEERKKKGI